ncbi:peptidylprolyl isomerase [Chryseosolibacter indicus]|uniref:Periplasmic chaperone PpiD n=1 Tax=Chryseosolibacter indicus TaxID=2782351 RepID=A0ABS5VT96_9BACT|nr:peptidylprolyl isomerase [Chryseosolibacter indicus]MBT1704655.1 SurA N-terminal domain-containing protein [Chryseosolibacter indicus]
MALIGTLRNKMGTWVVIFVFVAILAFILNDLFGSSSVLFNNNEVGEIGGHSVSLEEYQQAVQEREANYILNFGRQPGENEMPTLRQQAWELLILRYAIQKQYDKVGVDVPAEEQEDMVWGKNVDENIKQAFTNPQTGQFDKDRLISYLKELNNPPADPQMRQMWQEQRTRWEIFQRDLIPGRERIKYENLLIKTNYVTKAEAEREYHLQSDVAEARFVYVPYYAVSDSAANVGDSDLKDYYNRNKEKYKTEESRDVKYAAFPIVPTADDTLAIKNEMQKIAQELSKTEDDSAYASSNSEGPDAFGTFNVSSLPEFINSEDLKEGKVIGPFVDGNTYKVVKVSGITKDTVSSARASHILIKWDNETPEAKAAAKEKARNILKEIKGGASFEAKAREHGTDGTATRGGDLGWFSSGRMVKPFEDAVFAVNKPGLLNDVVETQFGYHIIKVTNAKDNTAYKLATVQREISASDETTNEIYRKAEAFAADLSDEKEFVERAKKEGYAALDAKNIGADERRIGTLGEARQIVQWAFRDASVGKVSEVFDLQDQYAVAVLTGKTDKGYRSLETVRDEILPLVRNEIKSKQIIEKLQAANGTLDEIAKAYGSDANVYSTSDLKLSSNSLPTAGFDPKAIGVAFSLENGKRSKPFAGENGVFVIEVQNKTVAPEIQEYSNFKAPLEQNALNRSSFSIAEAIKDNADIEDKRYKFY